MTSLLISDVTSLLATYTSTWTLQPTHPRSPSPTTHAARPSADPGASANRRHPPVSPAPLEHLSSTRYARSAKAPLPTARPVVTQPYSHDTRHTHTHTYCARTHALAHAHCARNPFYHYCYYFPISTLIARVVLDIGQVGQIAIPTLTTRREKERERTS